MANSPKWRQSLVRQFGYSWRRRLPNPSGPESEAFSRAYERPVVLCHAYP